MTTINNTIELTLTKLEFGQKFGGMTCTKYNGQDNVFLVKTFSNNRVFDQSADAGRQDYIVTIIEDGAIANTEIIASLEFQEIKYGKNSLHKSALLGISAKYPTVYFVGMFSQDGENMKNIHAFKTFSEANFTANKGNGCVVLNAEIL